MKVLAGKRALWLAGCIALVVVLGAGIALWLWFHRGPAASDGEPGLAEAKIVGEPGVRLVIRPAVKEKLSESTFVGVDGRMYSSYDTDGDGMYDADEIRQYGTLMHDPFTRQKARSIEYVEVPNPDDSDGDGLPDEWEMGYFGGHGGRRASKLHGAEPIERGRPRPPPQKRLAAQ